MIENSTFVSNIEFCAVNDCPGSGSVEIKPPMKSTVYLLCGIYVGCALVAVLITSILVDSHAKIGLKTTKKFNNPISLLINTIKHIKDKDQLLIIPLTLWSGFEQAYLGADFTKVISYFVLFRIDIYRKPPFLYPVHPMFLFRWWHRVLNTTGN